MNWDAVSAIAEIIGAVAVVATLLYLAVQIRQANRQDLLGSFQHMHDTINSFLRMIAESEPTLPYAHEGAWVERLCCHVRDIEEELLLLELTRSQLTRILRGIPLGDLPRTGLIKEQLYATASHQQKDLRGVGLGHNDLSG